MEDKEIILIAEDDDALCEVIQLYLQKSFDIICANNGEDTIRLAEEKKPALILLDYRLSDTTADKILNKLTEKNLHIPFIIMTGNMDVTIAIEMMKLGARDYILKNSTFFNFLPGIINRVIEELRTSKKLVEAEFALRESEDKYRRIVENSSILICHFIPKNKTITFVNNSFCKYLNKSTDELIGQSICDYFPDIEKKLSQNNNQLSTDQPLLTEEYKIKTSNGEHWQRWILQALFDKESEIIEYQATGEDITDWKKTEIEKEKVQIQLMQIQKMEAIGILAGGVAHDFNNLLTVIIGATNLCMQTIDESHTLYKNLSQINFASLRAADLTRQLLLFSRRQHNDPVELNLNNTLSNLLKMLGRLIGEDIAIDLNMETDLQNIVADEGNIEQVIMNLSINSRDAMPEGGNLIFITKNISLDNTTCKEIPEAKPGNFVCLSVRDTGKGINEETMRRIFEPFFTTKDIINNTGLGLSVVFGIIKQHDGWINVRSEPDKNTQFDIYFPAIEKDQRNKTIEKKSLKGQGERILLVEDQEELRSFSSNALRLNGYNVYEARDAKESQKIFENENGNFELVFCDVVLPDKNGLQLIEQLRHIKPGFKILFSSGYKDYKSQWSNIVKEGYCFLPKPYSLYDLLHAVKETIYTHKK